ncbi:MAG: histidinol dehydrogenase [Actinomycetota bacterium]
MLELIDGRGQQTPVHISRPRPVGATTSAEEAARAIVSDVRLRGDDALLEYSAKFDGARLDRADLRVDPDAIAKATSLVRPELLDALEVMAERLRRTCEHQVPEPWLQEDADEFVGELVVPLRRIGIYAPGGRAAYPSSVVMAAVPASVAGVEGLAVATPPGGDGEVPESILAACAVSGITEVYRMGGAHAIAALAFGTESVRPVEKVVGPGNAFVTFAKRSVAGWVGIDSEAGPTEIAVLADESADHYVIAVDLIAQAEHGPNGTHVLVTWVPELLERVNGELDRLVATSDRYEDVENALIEGGRGVLVRDIDHAVDTVNAFAPEHLQLSCAGARDLLGRIRNAGSVFVGYDSPVPLGDYGGSTNHVLPSGGTARYASGLGVSDFVKRIYVSGFDRSALERLAPHVAALAEAEGLTAHARAVEARLGNDPFRGLAL